MPNDDQLNGEDLTALMQVRAQLPEGDARGPKIDAFIKSQLQNFIPDATAQARQSLPTPQFTSPTDQLRAQLAVAQESPQYNQYMKESGMQAGTAAGTMATAGILPAVKGAGILNNIARLAGRSAATGAGAGIGAAAGGANPQEAATTAAAGAVAQPAVEGIGSLFSAIKGSLPKATQTAAGQVLGQVKQVAGKVPVNTGTFGDTALQLWQEGQTGAQLPRAVSRLVQRITQPNGQPLTYAEAKSFQSNISALSANERMAIKPNTARLIGQLNGELKQSLEDAAQLGGVEPGTFTGAMKQYGRAASQQEMINHFKEMAIKEAGKAAVRAGEIGAGGYAAYKALK